MWMNEALTKELTWLIESASAGDRSARDRLFEVVYDELRALARSNPYAGKPGHTLQPTVLANEAYLLLADKLPLISKMISCSVALTRSSGLQHTHWRCRWCAAVHCSVFRE